jgi:hypothetical protein
MIEKLSQGDWDQLGYEVSRRGKFRIQLARTSVRTEQFTYSISSSSKRTSHRVVSLFL